MSPPPPGTIFAIKWPLNRGFCFFLLSVLVFWGCKRIILGLRFLWRAKVAPCSPMSCLQSDLRCRGGRRRPKPGVEAGTEVKCPPCAGSVDISKPLHGASVCCFFSSCTTKCMVPPPQQRRAKIFLQRARHEWRRAQKILLQRTTSKPHIGELAPMALCDIHVAGCGEHLPAWGLRDDRIPGTDQASRGGRHGQKLHSGFPPRQADARGSADARNSADACWS